MNLLNDLVKYAMPVVNDAKTKARASNPALSEAEKTAGLLDGLMNAKGPLRSPFPRKLPPVSPLQAALKKAQLDSYSDMVKKNMQKKALLSTEDLVKTAATKEEKVEMRRLTGMAKRKVKKQKPNKTKESMYRMKKQQKKHADFNDTELEKMASLMADQFIAAATLQNVNPDAMDFETELIAGYKSYVDEVNAQ